MFNPEKTHLFSEKPTTYNTSCTKLFGFKRDFEGFMTGFLLLLGCFMLGLKVLSDAKNI